MPIYKVTVEISGYRRVWRSLGLEVYEVEAENEEVANDIVGRGSFVEESDFEIVEIVEVPNEDPQPPEIEAYAEYDNNG